MYLENVIFINDGKEVSREFMEKWGIEEYCDVYNKKSTISFVGIVIKKDNILFSFPKHYSYENLRCKDEGLLCMKEILSLLSSKRINKGSYDNDLKNLKEEIPLRAYIHIVNYYRKYGLYKSTEKATCQGYKGKINWPKTMNKANKIFQNDNILFYPFIINKVKDVDVFISECMDYVLNDAAKYQLVIDKIINYKSKFNSKIFSNIDNVCDKLNQIKALYFKDLEKKLIDSLIEYFTWKTKLKDNMKMLTFTFENYWQDMVNVYLNKKFSHVKDDRIIWSDDKKNYFIKPKKENVESKNVIARYKDGYKIEYDHLMIKDNTVYVFDSKYFNEVNGLNYKQLFYNYHLKQKYPQKKIVNGLILPTEGRYYAKIHIDRTDLDEIKIIEHYINLRDVIKIYRSKQ